MIPPINPLKSTDEMYRLAFDFLEYQASLSPVNTAMPLSQMIAFIVETLNADGTLRDALWARQLTQMEKLYEAGKRLSGDVGKAAQYLAETVMTRPHEIDRDEKFYFLTQFLNAAFQRLTEDDPDSRGTYPLSPPRDFIADAIFQKEVQLRDFVLAGKTVPPAQWLSDPSAKYPAAFPSHINMMLCNFNVFRYLAQGDAGERTEDIQRIYHFIKDPACRGETGCLWRDESLLTPADMAWAFARQGRQYLQETNDADPDSIWPEYQP